MQATDKEIAILQKLQELDRVSFRSAKALKSLPQPAEAQKVRERYDEVAGKIAKVEAMLAKQKRDFASLEKEDTQLRDRMDKVQGKIDSAEGNYRSVQTWTRDMQIMNDRRKVLDEKMTVLMEKISEIEAVRNQAAQGADQLKARERALYDEFQAQGTALKEEIAKCQQASKLLAQQVNSEVMKSYVTAVQRCGGVGLSRLVGDSCEACRTPIGPNRLPEIRKQAPLAVCPNCSRLMIIE